MTRRARLKSLAKLNLDLRVLYKRADGFHELRTVFQTISLADTVEIEYSPARKTELSIDDPLAIPDNLILRAAQSVLDELKLNAQVSFRLRKQIPMGGGLGGGSSNAATVLLGLPVLAGRALEPEKLHRIASALGSDVPYFLQGGTALGLGRGTELYPLSELSPEPILLVCPGLHVATGPAYKALDAPPETGLTELQQSGKLNVFQAFVETLGGGRLSEAAGSANDFERVVFRQYPQLTIIAQKLSKLGARCVRMTGSGSTVFGVFDSRQKRDGAQQALLEDRKFNRYLVKPASLVSRSSYRRLWQRQLQEHLSLSSSRWPLQSRYGR